MSATATQQAGPLKRYQLIRKLKQSLHRSRIRKADAKILKETLDDVTVDTNISMPRTLREALPEDMEIRAQDNRAIVVTECTGKFNMIGCNQAWENLCGFAECEIDGKDSSVLQGPDTNYDGLRDAVFRLFEGEKCVKVVTTNYRKDGSRFKNFLTLGPLHDEKTGKLTHFVAILKDIGNYH